MVWVIMRRRGYPQNTGVLVVLVTTAKVELLITCFPLVLSLNRGCMMFICCPKLQKPEAILASSAFMYAASNACKAERVGSLLTWIQIENAG